MEKIKKLFKSYECIKINGEEIHRIDIHPFKIFFGLIFLTFAWFANTTSWAILGISLMIMIPGFAFVCFVDWITS